MTDIPLNEDTFPDPILRHAVQAAFDRDRDGILTPDDIAEATYLDAHAQGIRSTQGLETLTALEKLDLSDNHIENIDLTCAPRLIAINIHDNQITHIDLTANPSLIFINLAANRLEEIDVTGNPRLDLLSLSGNRLEELDVTRNPFLTRLDAHNNLLQEIDLTRNGGLTTLNMSSNYLEDIDIRRATLLQIVDLHGNMLTRIDLSAASRLTALDLSGNRLTALDLSRAARLTELCLSANPLETVTVPHGLGREWLDEILIYPAAQPGDDRPIEHATVIAAPDDGWDDGETRDTTGQRPEERTGKENTDDADDTDDTSAEEDSAAALAEAKRQLDDMIGLQKVKDYMTRMEKNAIVQRRRQALGLARAGVAMRLVFAGNPGTGKTTVARLVARYLKALGILPTGQLVEASRADLVGEYQGHTAAKTRKVVESALGGVLFIDEAYALRWDEGDDFGGEAVDTLVKMADDHIDDLVIILAGYDREMSDFLDTNPGLRSRFPTTIHFDDYTPGQMWQITNRIAASRDYRISGDCEAPLTALFARRATPARNDAGNGRLARNLVDEAILRQATRIADAPDAPLDLLTAADFGLEDAARPFDLEAELGAITGLETVKDHIRSLRAQILVQQERQRRGLPPGDPPTLHMVFEGNPGTGKTTMARLAARLLHSIGALPTDTFVEAARSDLVSGREGGTAALTRHVVRSALGGILFIDEAHTLACDAAGHEAIGTLVAMAEDYRNQVAVILAGYPGPMEELLDSDPGLRSRFPTVIAFPDYTADELMGIALDLYSSHGYALAPLAPDALRARIEQARRGGAVGFVAPGAEDGAGCGSVTFGNARFVRNLYEASLRRQALRLDRERAEGTPPEDGARLMTITADDIARA